jgi:hypothetical protein
MEILQRLMIEWLATNDLERIWNETVVAYSRDYSNIYLRSEESHE